MFAAHVCMRTKFKYFNRVLLNKILYVLTFLFKKKDKKKKNTKQQKKTHFKKGKNNFANESNKKEHVNNMIKLKQREEAE